MINVDSQVVDEQWMQRAIQLAHSAEQAGEVPVGAVLIKDDKLIGEGWNRPISDHDPSAHAEIIALRQAAQKLSNYRLPGTTLYVTIEPCVMCAGSLIHARVERLVFGARDPKAGAVVSVMELLDNPTLNHHVVWQEGVLAAPCAELLTVFFKAKR